MWRFRGLDVKSVGDVTRLMTMSIVDILDRFFESDQVKTVMSLNGLIGTWAGPYEPGTGYVMAHHSIGDVGDGNLGRVGRAGGRDGRGLAPRSNRAPGRSAPRSGRTPAWRGSSRRRGAARGVALEEGEEMLAPLVVTAIHPKITFLQQLDPSELPEDFVRDIEHWSSRSGVVKINCALDRLPVFTSNPELTDQSGGVELAHSIAYLETAFEEARAGRPSTLPFSDGVVPTSLDPTLAPEGKHVISLFTQWVPHTWSEEPHRDELEAYADRVIAGYDELAPGFADSVLHRQVIGPYDMEHEWGLIGGNIFHGELSAEQLFHMRPGARVRGLPHADPRPVPVLQRHARRRRCHRHPGVQLRPGDQARPQAQHAFPIERFEAMTEQPHTTFPFYMATWYRKSPYYQRTVEAGCTSWDLYNHMLIPTLYDDDLKEYWHLLNHVTLWDVAVERQVEITGPDAARFTQLLTPRDLSSTQVGQCKYVLICAPDGGIVNDPILLKLAEDRFWLSLADSDALLYAMGVQAFAGWT